MLSVDEQMRIITSGAAKIVPEADLRKKLEKGEPLNIKLGVDPTSPDLHLGHAVPLRKMRQFQDLGHNVTLIIGNGTALIGDPSGKNSTRPQLSQEQIEANAETYVSQAMKILDPEKTTIVHNGDWILSMDLAGLLEEHGDHLLRLCTLYLGDRSQAEDAVQDTFLRALRAWPGF